MSRGFVRYGNDREGETRECDVNEMGLIRITDCDNHALHLGLRRTAATVLRRRKSDDLSALVAKCSALAGSKLISLFCRYRAFGALVVLDYRDEPSNLHISAVQYQGCVKLGRCWSILARVTSRWQ